MIKWPVKITILLLGLCVIWGLAACRQPAPEVVAETPTAVILPTARPALIATALATPTSSATPLPTATPTPSATPTPVYPVYQGPPLQRDLLGIQLHLRDEDQDELIQHLQELGVGWVKVQISWKLYEPEPDQYHAARLAELDEFVRRANEAQIKVLLGVSKAPEWSRPTTEMDGPPSDFALYERFMRDLARRYQGQVAAFELWNEPNLQREWNGFPLGGAEFARLVQAGAEGVRAVDSEAILIAGAPAVTGIDDGVTAVADRRFLEQMLAAGVANLVDGIGVHPYGFANPPDSSLSRPESTWASSHNNHPTFFFADTLHDYATILQNNDVELPLWATEFSWGSFENVGPAPPPGAEFMNDVTEWQQAENTLRAFQLSQEWNVGGPMFLWNLNFGPLLGTEFAESGYSILRPDGTKRPVYFSLAAAPKQ